MKIEKWQKIVDDWIKKYGVRYFDVKTNTLLLTEEVGEFARLIARSHGEQSFKVKLPPEEIKNKISEEIGDIVFVLTCLANQLDIDLSKQLEMNMKKKTNRDSQRHIKNQKLQ